MRSIINGVHRCTWLNFVAVHGCLSCGWSVFGSVILNQWCVSTVPRSETAVPYTHSTGAVFCHSNLGLQILRFTTNSASILHSLISATHPTYWIMFYSVFKEIGWHRKTMSQCWWTVVFKRFCTLINWTWEKKNTMHISIQHQPLTLRHFLLYSITNNINSNTASWQRLRTLQNMKWNFSEY